jgi:glycosyltransferase involved in cell wall biosynthesis
MLEQAELRRAAIVAQGERALGRLLYVVTEDWYFLSHRLPMARAARAAGFEVHVATRVQDGTAAIEAEGFVLHPVPFARGRLSPISALRLIRALRRVIRDVDPDLCHFVSLQASIQGSIAALGARAAAVSALGGLGYTFSSPRPKARLLRPFVSFLLRVMTNQPRRLALVQNPDDRDCLISIGVATGQIKLIPGSGVDVETLQPLPEPPGPIKVAFVGRLLEDKGIRTLIEAHRLLRHRGSDIELLIAGTPDPANPASIGEQEAAAWNREPGVSWLGHVDDIAKLWARAHFAVLPSYSEGLPKSLLEAAACGRAMIAADVSGCREIVRDGESGLLVPPRDPAALADAVARLAASPALCCAYGAAARQLAIEKFSADAIGKQTVALYKSLVETGA